MMSGYDMDGSSWYGMAIAGVCALVIVGLLLWVLVSRASREKAAAPLSAREILDSRLASGAIDARAYRERLDALSGDSEGV